MNLEEEERRTHRVSGINEKGEHARGAGRHKVMRVLLLYRLISDTCSLP
jgi:hypothetical protein